MAVCEDSSEDFFTPSTLRTEWVNESFRYIPHLHPGLATRLLSESLPSDASSERI